MKPKGSIVKRFTCTKDHKHGSKCPCTWWARVIYIDPETGKTRDLSRRAESYADAGDKRDALKKEIKDTNGRSIGTERMTFTDLCDHYEKHYLKEAEYVDANGRPIEHITFETELADACKVAGLRSLATPKIQLAVLKSHFGQRQLRSLTYGAIREFKSVRLKTKTSSDKQRSITSVNRELALLRRMLNIAVRESYIVGGNPFNQGDPLISTSHEKKRERIITRDEEKALLAACESRTITYTRSGRSVTAIDNRRTHLKPIVIAALDTGMRLGELLKLRWRDVDLDNSQINLIAFNTKTATARTVALTIRLRLELERLKAQAPEDPRMRVFGIVSNVKRAFEGARKDAGLPDVRFHDLRHSAATRLVGAHIPLAEVGRILGHQQPTTTYRYVNADQETAQRAAAALDRFHAVEPQAATSTESVN